MKFQHYEVCTREDGAPVELGRGAMGVTYKAFDTNLRCDVALKVISPGYLRSETAKQRFMREARAAARLRHPNVASVFHLGTEGETWFYAMEFIDGETVEALVRRRGPLPADEALEIADQAARALGAAAKHALVHRDLKPSNLMLVEEDGERHIKVIDFGLAKTTDRANEDSATLTEGGFLGTPHFASPEQLEERDLDTRSDLYSLGATLWYLLAGKPPFAGSVAQVMSQHLHKPPPFPELAQQPEPVLALLRRLLEKDPANRPQTPADLRREIAACRATMTRTPAAGAPPPDAAQGEFETVALPPPAPGPGTGQVIGGRFRLLDSGPGADGALRAEDAEAGQEIQLVPVDDVWLGENEGDLGKIPSHPNIVALCGCARTSRASYVAREPLCGFRLLDLLRRRRALPAAEAIPLLSECACALDFLAARGLAAPPLAPGDIFVHFPSRPEDSAKYLGAPVGSWPAHLIKVAALVLQPPAGPGATIVPPAAAPVSPVGVLAALAYELLGGDPRQSAYVPLGALSEHGNQVLREAKTGGAATKWSSAEAFVQDLAGVQMRPAMPVAPDQSTAAPPPLPPGVVAAPLSASAAPVPPPPPPVPIPAPAQPQAVAGAKPAKSRVPAFVAMIALVLLVVGGLGWFAVVSIRSATSFVSARLAASPTPAVEGPVDSGLPQPIETTNPVGTPEPAVVAATTPAATPVPTPEPTPDPESVFQDGLRRARQLEGSGDLPGALVAYAALLRERPESAPLREQIAAVVALIAAKSDSLPGPLIDPALREFSDAGIVPAMVLLAQRSRTLDPAGAFRLYSQAADAGDVSAMAQAGLMLSSGVGVARDLEGAVGRFAQAEAKGDAFGRYLLAECYFNGKGVEKDLPKAIGLLQAAVAQDEPRAMDLLGTAYRRGQGVPADNGQAFRLFERASRLGNLYSLGNLGVLYMNGEGVAPDPAKAVALFRQGAEAGNEACMFYLAMAMEHGQGLPADRAAAEKWYQKAAAAGNRAAADWCRKQGVGF